MKILLINKFLYPKGGAETYVLKLGEILEKKGHKVQFFGMESEKNTVGNQAGVYVSGMDFREGFRKNRKAAFRIISCREARRKLRRLLAEFQPDVVHFNNIHYHLTPSVILEAERCRRRSGRTVKLVYTAHDFQLVCPSHGLFDRNFAPCKKCLGGSYYHCLLGRCVKGSYAMSLAAMADGYYWRWRNPYAYLDSILCCSGFLKEKLDTQPRFAGKTVVMHNFAEPSPGEQIKKGDYVLQFGYLSREKGTLTLLEAAGRMPQTRFVFAGFGPAEGAIGQVPNAEFVGFQSGKTLETLIRRAKVTVCPSEIYENCPFSVIESQMYGVPVIGSRMGGIPELIEEGKTGELFEAGNVRQLEEKLRELLSDEERLSRYEDNCRSKSFMTAEDYYEKLMKLYGA